MIAIVLAGGLGTRLRPVTGDLIPKALVPVQGKPFLHWQLNYLKKQGIKKIILAVSFHAGQVIEYFGTDFQGLPLEYSVEKKALGTGGATKRAMTLTGNKPVFVCNGDTWFKVNLEKMRQKHRLAGHAVTLALKKMNRFDRYGSVSLGSKDRIVHFEEKKWLETGYINGGIYYFNPGLLRDYPPDTAFSLEKDFFEKMVKEIKIGGYRSPASFIDIGIPEDYRKIQSLDLR
ncbi:MAG TPA: nucleotidyltransferase family protein [Saprospiraceae bacterium]|nr:nucleotidyltransferase family protein [Saprospiraceae bacterium]